MISRSSLTDAYPKKQLGDVVEFLDSMRRPVTESDRRAGEYPYYGANGLQGTIDDFIFDEPLVLLAEDGGHFGTPNRGIAYRVSGKTWVNNHAHVLRPKECVDLGFLCRVLENYDVTPWVTGTTRGKLTQAGAAQIVVPLPPLPMQRRIAETLDKADALRAKRRAALAQLDTLTQSIFLDMFGDPATNPKAWPVVSVGDICEVKGGKRLPKGEEYSSAPTPFRYIRVVDLKGGRIDESALVYLKPDIQVEIARYVVNAGDVVISIAGSIGLVAAVPESLNGVNLTENAAKLVPRTAGQYDAAYLAEYLRTEHAQGEIGSHVGQVTIGKLALFRIEKLGVPLPPRDLQLAFIQRQAAVNAHASTQLEAQSRLDALFGSLQHRAFQGEL